MVPPEAKVAAAYAATFFERLNFAEYGGWYVALLAMVAAFTQRKAGMDEAKEIYEGQLIDAREKAALAADAASVAAKEAALAKKLADSAVKGKATATIRVQHFRQTLPEPTLLQISLLLKQRLRTRRLLEKQRLRTRRVLQKQRERTRRLWKLKRN